MTKSSPMSSRLSARNQRDAQKALLWSGPVVLLQFVLFLVIGVGLAAFYRAQPPAVPFKFKEAPPGVVGIRVEPGRLPDRHQAEEITQLEGDKGAEHQVEKAKRDDGLDGANLEDGFQVEIGAVLKAAARPWPAKELFEQAKRHPTND